VQVHAHGGGQGVVGIPVLPDHRATAGQGGAEQGAPAQLDLIGGISRFERVEQHGLGHGEAGTFADAAHFLGQLRSGGSERPPPRARDLLGAPGGELERLGRPLTDLLAQRLAVLAAAFAGSADEFQDAHWCTLSRSVIVDRLPMHLRCCRVTALLA
jgi:hypothetical protein